MPSINLPIYLSNVQEMIITIKSNDYLYILSLTSKIRTHKWVLEQDAISTTVQTQNDEKKISKKYWLRRDSNPHPHGFRGFRTGVLITSC